MDEPKVIPVIEEELVAERQQVKTGSVRVQKHVQRRTKRVESTVLHDDVEVRRVAVNREIKTVPRIRREGEIIIVPVVEEEIVVTKRLVLKEELHILRKRSRQRVGQDIELQQERAVVERLDAEGRVISAVPLSNS